MIQENNYLIHVVGFAPISFHGNAQRAIAKGSSYCYVSPLRRDALLGALQGSARGAVALLCCTLSLKHAFTDNWK